MAELAPYFGALIFIATSCGALKSLISILSVSIGRCSRVIHRKIVKIIVVFYKKNQ